MMLTAWNYDVISGIFPLLLIDSILLPLVWHITAAVTLLIDTSALVAVVAWRWCFHALALLSWWSTSNFSISFFFSFTNGVLCQGFVMFYPE